MTTAHPTCGAKLRGSNPPRYCRLAPVRGRTRCRLHGGRSLAGPASPTWRHGFFSRVLDGTCRREYHARRQDPRLVELREHLALVDARLLDTLERLRTGESLSAWERVGIALQELQAAATNGELPAAMVPVLERLERAYNDGAATAEASEEIDRQLLLRARLTVAETRRTVFARDYLPKETANNVAVLMVETIKRLVPDRAVLQEIVGTLRQLQAGQSTQQVLVARDRQRTRQRLLGDAATSPATP